MGEKSRFGKEVPGEGDCSGPAGAEACIGEGSRSRGDGDQCADGV